MNCGGGSCISGPEVTCFETKQACEFLLGMLFAFIL